MVVLLPRKHDGLPDLEKQLTATNLNGWMKGMNRACEVSLHLPKFKSESRFQLADKMKNLGMPLAFDSKLADLRGMALLADHENLFISKVIHQSFVEVNEEGTEAAAATAVEMAYNNSYRKPQPSKIFRADHPFLYLIRDTKTGNILFLGRYAGP
jgi:serpin B